MKKLRVFLATAMMASAFLVVSAGPASANCTVGPTSPCAMICHIGLRNEHTAPYFRFCYVW